MKTEAMKILCVARSCTKMKHTTEMCFFHQHGVEPKPQCQKCRFVSGMCAKCLEPRGDLDPQEIWNVIKDIPAYKHPRYPHIF